MTKAPGTDMDFYFWHPSLRNDIACCLACLLKTTAELYSASHLEVEALLRYRAL
jgi:hypothetical protein